ncbi:hypothetical protein ACFV3R_22265 [Streptomyces sp. NPDC059740]|uniref:hypothetical protein n=1 Tax=Streptomyces sp. NPDC059740 TaxID=3346926 RepID=UPI003662D282
MTPTPRDARDHRDRAGRRAERAARRRGPRGSTRPGPRREVPGTVAVLAGARDYAAMRRYPSFQRAFPFEDHGAYLRGMDELLRLLDDEGLHTSLALFDPPEFASFCRAHGLDPDAPASRTRYTAEVAGGRPLLTYEGQDLRDLLPVLAEESEHQTVWRAATDVLARAAASDATGRLVHTAMDTATGMLAAVLAALGEGTHHLVVSTAHEDTSLTAALHAVAATDRRPRLASTRSVVFCTVLAAGIVLGGSTGLVSRTSSAARDTVRGWSVREGRARPLTAGEVFAAYCTDAETGEPLAPEPDVDHAPGLPLEPPGPPWPGRP